MPRLIIVLSDYAHGMLGVRRPSLVRQMAFRQDSNDSELSIRHGHLAANVQIPDSPRPQKDSNSTKELSGATIAVQVPDQKKEPVRLESIVLEEKAK